MQATSKPGQWLGDVSIREAGSIESVVEMAIMNDFSITDKVTAGSSFFDPQPLNKRVMNYYKLNSIFPATDMNQKINVFGGIGFMAVQITFIVS